MALVYLGLGTNLGDKMRNLNDALSLLAMEVGEVLCQSSFYESKPNGFESENDFLNAAVLVETSLSPFDLLAKTQMLESQLGRATSRAKIYVDRIIDIDILMYENRIINQPALKIPHPLFAERDFVLIPMAEIAPEMVHPLLGKTMLELKFRLTI